MVKKILAILIFMPVLWGASLEAADRRDGLGELTAGQMANSVFITFESTYAFDLYYRQTVGLSLLLLSAGIITPNAATKGSTMDTARARTINCSTLWGSSTGMLLGLSIDNTTLKTQSWFGLVFDAAATASASALTAENALSIDSLSVINSGGIWGLGLGYSMFELFDADLRDMEKFLLAGQTLGLAGGFLTARENFLTRERMMALDCYMILSGGLAYGITSMTDMNKQARFLVTVVSAMAGACLGYWQTMDWDRPSMDYIRKSRSGEALYRICLPVCSF